MIEGAGIVAGDARHIGRLGEEHRARLEDVRGEKSEIRPATWPATGSSVVGVAVGSAGGKSRTWPRPLRELVRRHVPAVAEDVDRGRLVREPGAPDGIMPDELDPEGLAADLGLGRLRDRVRARREDLVADLDRLGRRDRGVELAGKRIQEGSGSPRAESRWPGLTPSRDMAR